MDDYGNETGIYANKDAAENHPVYIAVPVEEFAELRAEVERLRAWKEAVSMEALWRGWSGADPISKYDSDRENAVIASWFASLSQSDFAQ